MGSGKSYLAHYLGKVIDFAVVELDNRIEKNMGCSIDEIFKIHGEEYFRNLEYLEIQKIINSEEKQIVSLGGGTYCQEKPHNLINENEDSFSVYLKYEPLFLRDRLENEKQHRPIISSKQNLLEFIEQHLDTRKHFYNQAELIISDETDVEKMVNQVISYKAYLDQKLSTI